jgi:hypothetical protein
LGVFGEQHAVLASTLVLQARALLALGEANEAEALLVCALGIQQGAAAAGEAAMQQTSELLGQARVHLTAPPTLPG